MSMSIQPALPPLAAPPAVADVWQLLPAKALLEADLGLAAASQVGPLSSAYSEWRLDPQDRAHSRAASGNAGGSYAAAVRLPFGKDMQLSIDAPDFRPRWAQGLFNRADDGGGGGAQGPQRWQRFSLGLATGASLLDPWQSPRRSACAHSQ